MAKKILVVDDDKDILDILSIVLFEKSYHVIPSQTSKVMPYLEQIKPDLILLDNWLTDGLGSELCKDIKSNINTRSIPVILISAVNELEQIARECLADGYIKKPFELNELEIAIANSLNQ